MAVARAGQRDTSTPGGSSGLPLVVKVAARYDAAGGAGSKLPAGVSRVMGAPTRASYVLRAKPGMRSTHIASRRPTPPAVPPANWTKRCWPGTGSPARMFPKPTTYARARPRMTCAPTVSTSTRRAASESRSPRIVSLVTTYPATLNNTMSRGSASPNEPAERSRECFKGSVHRAAPPEPWQAFNRMRRGRAGRRGTARRRRSPGGLRARADDRRGGVARDPGDCDERGGGDDRRVLNRRDAELPRLQGGGRRAGVRRAHRRDDRPRRAPRRCRGGRHDARRRPSQPDLPRFLRDRRARGRPPDGW